MDPQVENAYRIFNLACEAKGTTPGAVVAAMQPDYVDDLTRARKLVATLLRRKPKAGASNTEQLARDYINSKLHLEHANIFYDPNSKTNIDPMTSVIGVRVHASNVLVKHENPRVINYNDFTGYSATQAVQPNMTVEILVDPALTIKVDVGL